MSPIFKEAKAIARMYLAHPDPDLPDDPPQQKAIDDEHYIHLRREMRRDWPRMKRGEFTLDEDEWDIVDDIAHAYVFAILYRKSSRS